MRDLSKDIQDEEFPMRRDKILDHLVFCGNLKAHTPFILTNELSLGPRAQKISDNFGKLEAMILASITEIERMKVLAEESNAGQVADLLDKVEEDPDEDLLQMTNAVEESKAVDDGLMPMTILDMCSE